MTSPCLAGYYLFPDDADFRWQWVCSGCYLKSLSVLHKPALVASILPSQEWHIGYSCCSSWRSRWSFRDNKIYIVLCRHRHLGVVIGAKGLSLISNHFHQRMPKAGLFPPVRYFLRKSQECVSSIAEISITSRSLSNIIMIATMRKTLVYAKCFIRYNSMQSSLFFSIC